MRALEIVAADVTSAMPSDAVAMQRFLDQRVILLMLINAGLLVAGLDGIAIADSPIITGRTGMNYSDTDWLIDVLKGRSTISSPVIGKKWRAPPIAMAYPIRDAKGQVIGSLCGVVTVDEPSVLTEIANSGYSNKGGYILVSPQIRTIVFATDKTRIMEVLPGTGTNSLLDRFIQG